MDYEQKYKDALEWARKVIQGKVGFVLDEVLEKFPELKESEDERVKEAIIATIHLYYGEPLEDEAKEMIAWIEKKGEQILANSAKTCKDEQEPTDEEMKTLLRTEYEKGRADAIAEIKKSAWNEEDEGHIDSLLKRLEGMCKTGATFISTRFAISEDEDWLKSLKKRYTWKPSDEQMKALNDINLTGNISYAGQGQVLIELYNDLLKLKT